MGQTEQLMQREQWGRSLHIHCLGQKEVEFSIGLPDTKEPRVLDHRWWRLRYSQKHWATAHVSHQKVLQGEISLKRHKKNSPSCPQWNKHFKAHVERMYLAERRLRLHTVGNSVLGTLSRIYFLLQQRRSWNQKKEAGRKSTRSSSSERVAPIGYEIETLNLGRIGQDYGLWPRLSY